MVNWTREQRNDFRTTGKMLVVPKADTAPASKPSGGISRRAAASETAKTAGAYLQAQADRRRADCPA